MIILAFRMLDMSLQEILNSLYIVEPDAMKIWMAMLKAYPSGAFYGIIEDMGAGGKVSDEAMKKLRDEVADISANCHREIARAS